MARLTIKSTTRSSTGRLLAPRPFPSVTTLLGEDVKHEVRANGPHSKTDIVDDNGAFTAPTKSVITPPFDLTLEGMPPKMDKERSGVPETVLGDVTEFNLKSSLPWNIPKRGPSDARLIAPPPAYLAQKGIKGQVSVDLPQFSIADSLVMQNKKRAFAQVDPERPEPTSNHGDPFSRAQLSENMTRRLEKLAPWRIDPSLVEFSNLGPNFEGGCAVVSRALLYYSSGDAQNQLLQSNTRGIMTSNEASKPEGADECREQEASEDEARSSTEGATGRQEHDDDAEISGGRKPVAVKKMKVKTRSDVVKVLGLTIREAEFLVNHSHENIIKLEGFVEDVSKNIIWLIFPWEENGNLKKFIASAKWEIPERISLLRDVARGIEYLHTRDPPICHGDLKSANILVNSKCRAVITDFGSAHHPTTEHPDRKRKRARIGPQPAPSPEARFCPSTNTITLTHNKWTLRWAAPELLEKDHASLASDVWAFGCVVYEVMTDSIPFQDVNDLNVIERVVRGDLPSISSDARMRLIQALCSLMGQCWSIDPSERPTAKECRGAIGCMPRIVPNAADLSRRSAGLLMQLGRMHCVQSDYPNASKYFVEALDLYTNIADKNGEANALLEHAEIHRFQNNYSQAVTSYSDALKIQTDIGDRHGIASALFGLAEVHRARNEYSDADTLYSECLQIRTDISDRRGRASALFGLAEVHRARNQDSQAVTFYSKCLQIQTDIGDRHGRADALFGLAEVHRARNEDSQAATFYSECLQIRTDIGDRHGRADALFGLAEVHRARNDCSQAVTFYSECLQIRTDIGDRHGRADALWGLAEVHRARNEYSEAVTFYSECLQIRIDISYRRGRASDLQGLADRFRSEYNQAIRLYSECLQIRADIGDSHWRADALWGLAEVHRARNEYSQAVTFYSKCLQIRTDNGDRHGRADALWGLAEVHRARNEYSEAVTFYSECLQIQTDIGDRHWRADTLFGLADVHRLRNEDIQAITFYSECLQIRTDIGDRRGRADALWGLAEVHRARNEYSEAVTFYSESLQIQTDIGDRHGRASALWGLAEVHRLRTEHSQALSLFSEALQISIDIGSIYWKAFILLGVANTHHDQAQYSGALHHYEQAAEAFQQLGHIHNEAFAWTRASDARQLVTQKEAA